MCLNFQEVSKTLLNMRCTSYDTLKKKMCYGNSFCRSTFPANLHSPCTKKIDDLAIIFHTIPQRRLTISNLVGVVLSIHPVDQYHSSYVY